MRFKFKRNVLWLFTLLLICNSIPFNAFALTNINGETIYPNGELKDEQIYKDSELASESSSKSLLISDEQSCNIDNAGWFTGSTNQRDFNKIIEFSNGSLEDLEDALEDGGLVYEIKADNIRIKEKYTGSNINDHKVILTTKIHNNNCCKFKANGGGIHTIGKYFDTYDSKVNRYGLTGVVYVKESDDNVSLILRYYLDMDGETLEYQDFDLTDAIIKASNSDTSKYPVVNYLVSRFRGLSEEARAKEFQKQKEVFETYKTYSASGISYEYKNFWTAFNSRVIGDSTGNPNVGTKSEDDTVNLASSLYFYALQNGGVLNFDTKKIAPDFVLNINGNYPGSTENTTGFDMLSMVNGANAVANTYNKKAPAFSSADEESNASMFNDLIRYKYGKLSGAKERQAGSTAADQIMPVSSLDNLLLSKDELTSMRVINPALWEQIPSMKQFQFEVKIDQLMDVMTMLQYLEYYAEEERLSGIKEADNFTNKALEDELTKLENEAKSNESNKLAPLEDSTLIRQVKAYIQIKKGLDYVGIKPWTKQLEYICGDIYGRISNLPISEEFDEYDNQTEPLGRFFSVDNEKLSTNYLTGVALSATYIPMQTNLYDPKSIRVLENQSWLSDFHIRYGFYRKALMIDTNVNAAVDGFITESRDTLRVATLNDLLQTEKDIVLYVDDNFYNTDEVAEMTGKVYERLANTEQAGMNKESFKGFFDNLFNNSIEHIVKTGPRNVYDESIINNVKQYGQESAWSWESLTEALFTDGIIFSSGRGNQNSDEIKEGLDQKEYSINQSYAVVSGIYRHKKLANDLNDIAKKPYPVFISSPALFNITDVNQYQFNTIFNYYMLKNLEASMGVDYRTTLDVDNPLYIDIYGNILTESGLVVIPAASNATLYPESTYSPYTLGFMDLYSNGVNIPVKDGWAEDDSDTNNFTKYLKEFTVDEESGLYLQNNYEFDGVPVNPQRPSVSDEALLEKLYDNQVSILNDNGYDFNQRIWLITEVMRGAPIENVDKIKEGLTGKRDINKYGLYMSWKLDEIAGSILPTTNGNSLISMPNLAFIDGVEYVVLFAFKAMLLLFVIYIMYRVYIDAIGGKLGLGTLWRCVSTIVIFCIAIVAIPKVISLSYNEPNKIFLQDEIKYINLLNNEKNLEGREISAVGVEEPKSQTKLYLKIDSIDVPWYKVLQEVMFAPVDSTLEEIYKEELSSNMLYGYDDVQIVNDGAYIAVDDLFKSSNVVYNVESKFLYQYVNKTPTASYFIPYYYLMDNMLSSINVYNTDNGIINISTKIQSDGSVKTMGMIGDYLLSEYFLLEDEDPLGLYELYNISTQEQKDFVNVVDDAAVSVKESMWYVGEYYDEEDIKSRIDQLYSHMRSYVATNREMIGRVTDETFIKTMMLDLSIKYNQLFKIPAARGIEVFGIDSRDIIRLSITDKNDSVINSAYSFGRFVYEESGGLGVILTAILMGILFVTSVIKPALVIFLCVLLIYNVLIKSMISMSRSKTIEGLLYVLSILVIVNSVYSLFIKLSMSLPELGLNPALSIIGQIVIQVCYLLLVFKLVGAIIKDYENMGFNIFHTAALAMAGIASNTASRVRDKMFYSEEQQSYMDSARLKSESSGTREAEDLREEMERRDRKRDAAEEETAFLETIYGKDNQQNNNE